MRTRVFLSGLLLAASALPASAQSKPQPTAAPAPMMVAPSPTAGTYVETTLQTGTQWQLVRATGYDDDGQYFDANLYKIQDVAGVNDAPLPAGLKADILASFPAANSAAITLPQSLVDEAAISEQQGYLTPTLQAIAEPGEGGPTPIPIAVAARDTAAAAPGVSPLRLFGRCSDKIITRTRTFDVNTPLNQSFTLGGGFSGSVSLTGDAGMTATGTMEVAEHRYAVFGWCVPIGVKFKSARANGNGHINLGTTLSGTVNYTKNWEWEIAKPKLFSFTFAIGYVPVYVGFNLPITAGLDLDASVTGSVTYTGAQSASGTFDYRCTLNGCSGTSSFTTTGPLPQPATASISGRVQPAVWAQVAFRGYLYTEAFAYAQAGVRGYLQGDLWGFYGNNCGDANGDGIYETVNALTFDLDWQVKITAEADTFLTSKKNWTLKDFGRRHIQFWDLIGSSAITPELSGLAVVPPSPPPAFGAKMRSCWPYAETVNYRMGWGDGTSTPFAGAPQAVTNVSHNWASTGSKTIDLSALGDAHGRNFSNKTTSRVVQVQAAGPLDMSCYPMGSISGCSIAGYWAGVSAPLTFLYSASNSNLQIVYPSPGTFPYSTNNGVIYFGLRTSAGTLTQCPSGTPVSMTVWNAGSLLGTVTRSCP
jgi:hypothetical protein